ncbi:MAG: hypothetical protein ABL904_14590 [Hyphomicrobiaceae bacterium]
MTLAPGKFPWLLVHDMRLNWRRFESMFGTVGVGTTWLLLLVGAVLLHLAAWPLVFWLQPFVHGADAATTPMATLVTCIFTWMIAQSLFGISRVLFDRGDLDLLLGSPVSTARVFAAKAVAVAAGTFGSIAVLVIPVADTGAIVDRAAWLGFYPVLIAMAMIATSIAIAVAIGLFFLVGARRARLYTQMVGAVIGGIFVLGAQIAAMLPVGLREAILSWFSSSALARGEGLGRLLWLPIDGLRGDPGAMLLLMAIGSLLLGIAVIMLGDRFSRASLAAAGASIESGRCASRRENFRGGFGSSLRRKEWRLLARDPNLFAQIGLQIVYTVPIAVVLLRNENLPAVLALAPTIVVVASQVAASLAWIVVSGEDAPELIASAPVVPAAVDWAKLSSITLPVALILTLPMIGLALVSLTVAAITTMFCVGAVASSALLNLWHPMPGNRRGMLRRHSQSKLIGLVEHGIAVSWAVAIVLALLGSWYAVVPIAVAAGMVLIPRNRNPELAGLTIGTAPGAMLRSAARIIGSHSAFAGRQENSR